MVAYTQKLDRLLTDYADHLEKQVKTLIDPQVGVVRTLRAAFTSKKISDRLVTEICRELGWKDAETWSTDEGLTRKVTELATIAEQNGNPAAATKLKKALAVFEAIDNVVPQNAGLLKGLSNIKRLKLSY